MNSAKRICLVRLVVLLVLFGTTHALAGTRQEHIHHMAHSVMPFDISRVVHIFRMTETGGVQRVVSKDPGAADQIVLIQDHLEDLARRFQKGDYSAPTTLHGADMPGLRELQAGAPHIHVSYQALPNGAAITFETDDIHLLTAIHRWFGAQLSEHGADAMAE